MNGELELHAGKAVDRAESAPLDIVGLINTLAKTPSLTLEQVAIVERLVGLQERQESQRRKEAFDAALLRVQKVAPRVAQNGLMDRGTGGKIAYAKREDIDACVRPLYQAEGFTVTWDAPSHDDTGLITVTGHFSCAGHTEKRVWSCKPDPSGGKTGPQAVSSTIAYGKRQISKMVWDIIEEGLDKNGAKPDEPITEDQSRDLQSALDEVGGNKAAFLKLLDAPSFSAIKSSKLEFAHQQIALKRQKGRA